jgi:hypothetical protein
LIRDLTGINPARDGSSQDALLGWIKCQI